MPSWYMIPSVPIYHEEFDEEWDLMHGPLELVQFAANTNVRYRTIPLTIGHCVPGVDYDYHDEYVIDCELSPTGEALASPLDKEVRPIVGHATKFRAGQLYNDLTAVLADFYLPSDRAEQIVTNYPQRSVQLNVPGQYFQSVALLRPDETPACDLPVVYYSRPRTTRRGRVPTRPLKINPYHLRYARKK